MSFFCDGKTKYHSKGSALERIKRHMTNRRRLKRASGWDSHCELSAYRCTDCGHWHTGAADRKRPAPKRRFQLTKGALDV